MKKFLLSLIALTGVATMNAESVTFDFVNETYGLTRYSKDDKNPSYIDNNTKLTANGGVEVTLTKAEGKNGWRMWTDGLRAYKSSDAGMTISAPGHKITKVSYTMAKASLITAINGTTVSGQEFSYATSGEETVTLAYTVSNNGAIATMSVELDGEGGGVDPNPTPDPGTDPVETVGDGTEAKPYTVADVIALNNTKPGSAWVKGYIVGAMNSQAEYTLEVAAPFTVASNVYLAASVAETDSKNMLPVQLVSGSAVRKAVNLVDNPGNFGKELLIKGSLEKYFSQPGIKSPTDYKLNGGGGTDPTPVDPEVPTTGPGSEEQPYTCAEAIAKNNDGSMGWVNGYIVGVMLYDDANKKNYFSTAVNGMNSNIVIAASADETDEANMICVMLPAGSKVREDLNLADRPGNMGKEVSVCGKLEKYCGIHGVKGTSKYSIVGGIAPLPVTETPSLTTFVEEQSESNMKITGAVTVFYQSPDKKYTFITDGETNLEVFGVIPEYKNGDQLTGIVGKYGFYKNMPQMTPQTDSFGEATPGTPVEPTEVAIDQINIAQYVKVISVEIYEENSKFYIGQGDAKRQVFDRFNLGGLKAGVCTITGIGAIFDTTVQIFPTVLDYKGGSNITEITAGNAKSEIFDLQGRKVTKATNGVYIVNGKKTFIR